MVYLISNFDSLSSIYLKNSVAIVLFSLYDIDLTIIDIKWNFFWNIVLFIPWLWLEKVS